MKKTKIKSLFFIGFLLIIPYIKVASAQGLYPEIEEGDEFLWKLSVYRANFEYFFEDNLGDTLRYLWPISQIPGIDMSSVYFDWLGWHIRPPQSHWPFTILAMGSEETGTLLAPFDNTIITSISLNATAGWHLPQNPEYNSYYNGTWHIVNDTSSFLRQTFNLSLAFSPYAIMGVPFAPLTINWESFIAEFLEAMDSRGGYYKNISATAESHGYALHIPAGGFENNTRAIEIRVKYNPKGVFTYYEFLIGGYILVKYSMANPDEIALEEMLTIIWGGIIIVGVAIVVVIMRWVVKHNK
jgi:hypothetical protein